jgi:hypothetical protein
MMDELALNEIEAKEFFKIKMGYFPLLSPIFHYYSILFQ